MKQLIIWFKSEDILVVWQRCNGDAYAESTRRGIEKLR
jgi:hypothetical protein